jgi:hypothetical protein
MREDFGAASREFAGRFSVHAPVETVFELFSPLGERGWVPDWDPELIHPPGVSWDEGQIFRTREKHGEAIWIVTRLRREAHQVEYCRVEPDRYIARVSVTCTPSGGEDTEAVTRYAYVGLSREGNEEIAKMTDEAYSEKMARWKQWISEYLARRVGGTRTAWGGIRENPP